MGARYLFSLFFLLLVWHAAVAQTLEPTATIEIPMRDGALLPADIYLPEASARGLPCILLRTPNKKSCHAEEYGALAQYGYAVVIEDTRSILDIEGKRLPYFTDAWGDLQDGYDTIQWLAKSPYTNGQIGTAGVSAVGIAQLLLAPSAPPNLVCQYIGFAAGCLYNSALYDGGRLQKNVVEGWLGLYAKDPSVLTFILSRPLYDSFWANYDSTQAAHRIQVPALLYGGWYDVFLKGIIDAFVSRQYAGGEGARNKQKLIIGPWTHHWPSSMNLGDFDIPENGRQPPVDMSMKTWFDHYLKGLSNSIDTLPAVTYYVMGPLDGTPSQGNVWRSAESWPIPAKATQLFLTEKGALSESLVEKQSHRDYSYDPHDPVPTIGGRNLFLASGPKDQRSIEERADVLIFSTEALKEDLEVTGPITATIYCSSDQSDADIVVRLMDVYPDGRSILISDGIRHIDAKRAKEGALVAAEVDLWSTSQVFAKGHRIRVSVSSSNYPKFDSPGGDSSSSVRYHTRVYMGRATPSAIVLPVVVHSKQ